MTEYEKIPFVINQPPFDVPSGFRFVPMVESTQDITIRFVNTAPDIIDWSEVEDA